MKSSTRVSRMFLASFLLATVTPLAFAGRAAAGDKTERTPRVMLFEADGEHGAMRKVITGRGFIGVNLTALSPELREHFGGSKDAGILVASLASGGPAEKAGVKVGDVITAINGDSVASHIEVLSAVRRLKEGDVANLDLLRDGRRESIAVTIEERDRERIDLGEQFGWKSKGDGEFDMYFAPDGIDIEGLIPKIHLEGLGERLKAIDWKEIAERSGRSTEELEARLAELEKKLADLSKKLEAAAKNR